MDNWLLLLAGLMSAGHCVGMCGGLVTAYSMESADRLKLLSRFDLRRLTPHLLYNGGRVFVYTLLGAVFGTLGGFAEWIGFRANMGGVVHLLFGLLMLAYGLSALGVPGMQKWADQGLPDGLFNRLSSPLNRLKLPRPLIFGLLTGLLPCNLHFAMQVKAAATGSPWQGMILLMLFGIGTAIPLTLLGIVAFHLSEAFRKRLFQGAGVVIMILAFSELMKALHSFS